MSSFFKKACIAEFVLIIEYLKNTEKNQKEKLSTTVIMAYFFAELFFVCVKSDSLFFPCLAQYHKCFLLLLFLYLLSTYYVAGTMLGPVDA